VDYLKVLNNMIDAGWNIKIAPYSLGNGKVGVEMVASSENVSYIFAYEDTIEECVKVVVKKINSLADELRGVVADGTATPSGFVFINPMESGELTKSNLSKTTRLIAQEASNV